MSAPSTPAALAKLGEAMMLVEEAQNTLERACQRLSSLRHGSDLYGRCQKLRDGAEGLWFTLSEARHTRKQMSVDTEPEVK